MFQWPITSLLSFIVVSWLTRNVSSGTLSLFLTHWLCYTLTGRLCYPRTYRKSLLTYYCINCSTADSSVCVCRRASSLTLLWLTDWCGILWGRGCLLSFPSSPSFLPFSPQFSILPSSFSSFHPAQRLLTPQIRLVCLGYFAPWSCVWWHPNTSFEGTNNRSKSSRTWV